MRFSIAVNGQQHVRLQLARRQQLARRDWLFFGYVFEVGCRFGVAQGRRRVPRRELGPGERRLVLDPDHARPVVVAPTRHVRLDFPQRGNLAVGASRVEDAGGADAAREMREGRADRQGVGAHRQPRRGRPIAPLQRQARFQRHAVVIHDEHVVWGRGRQSLRERDRGARLVIAPFLEIGVDQVVEGVKRVGRSRAFRVARRLE